MSGLGSIAIMGACEPERRAYGRALARVLGCRHVTGIELLSGRSGADEGPRVIDVPLVVPPSQAAAMVEEEHGDALLCVVDARHMVDDLRDDAPLIADAEGLVPLGQPGSRALHTAQGLEYATMTVLVNWEQLPTEDLSLLLALAAHLGPRARLRLSRGPADDIAGSRRAAPPAHGRPGWVAALNGEHRPTMTDGRVRTVRYEQIRPFHPGRLRLALDERLEAGECGVLLRSVGFCRLATRPRVVGQWEHVGSCMWLHPLAADEGDPLSIGQDLAFTGLDIDTLALYDALDAAALTDDELAAGPDAWARLPDPLPRWADVPR